MREIEFRGKSKDKKDWVYGYYVKHLDYTPGVCDEVKEEDYKHYIFQDGFSDWNMPRNTVHFKVIPETVGQYVEVDDIKEKKMFGGDIVKCKYPNTTEGIGMTVIGVIEYVPEVTSFRVVEECGEEHVIHPDMALEVKGNTHDNPELLQEDTDDKK